MMRNNSAAIESPLNVNFDYGDDDASNVMKSVSNIPPLPESPPVREKSILLHDAVLNKDATAVREITKNKDPSVTNHQDKDGNTPLHLATGQKDPRIFWLLIDAGADLSIKNNKDQTPIYRPRCHKTHALALWDRFNNTASAHAVVSGCFEVLAPAFALDLQNHSHDLLTMLKEVSPEIAQNFAQRNLPSTALNCLMYICKAPVEYLELVKFLVELNPEDATRKNYYNKNALDYAAEQHHRHIMAYLDPAFNANNNNNSRFESSAIPNRVPPVRVAIVPRPVPKLSMKELTKQKEELLERREQISQEIGFYEIEIQDNVEAIQQLKTANEEYSLKRSELQHESLTISHALQKCTKELTHLERAGKQKQLEAYRAKIEKLQKEYEDLQTSSEPVENPVIYTQKAGKRPASEVDVEEKNAQRQQLTGSQ